MAGNGIEMGSLAAARARLLRARGRGPERLRQATKAALALVEKRAKEILDREIYDKSHPGDLDPPNKSDADSLYNHFVQELSLLGRTVTSGTVGNNSDHAGFLEFGTDDEGTGSHFVPVIRGSALHWVNPATGASAYSKGHEVKGIVPIRFMERALRDHKDEVAEIFRRHFSGLFTN